MYVALIEPAPYGFTAYSPDFPVCSVKGATENDAQEALRKAILGHIGTMKALGLEIPKGQCKTAILKITE
ncbi:MAG: type II toxin-antitoxin system HicB family antitoxin [Methylomicrobium sp.]|jgi:predicted RNase H-like HicB family nuclease